MTSPTSNPQQGISLMLAVLVLAAITAIAFSLAAIVFIEIRSSGDVLRTEPALYATLGVTEEALFQYKRFVDDSELDIVNCQPEVLVPCTLNGVTLSFPGTQPIRYDDVPRVQAVAANTTVELPMYEYDYEGGQFAQQYSRAVVEILPTGFSGQLPVRLRETEEDGTVNYYDYDVSYGTPLTLTDFNTSGQFDLILNNTNSSDVIVALYTYGLQDEEKGFPFVGQKVLDAVADYLGLTRTYRVQIPTP